MQNTVIIDNYFDGFLYSQMDCEEIPMAGTAGAYDRKNFFFYCFYVSVCYNWSEVNTKDKASYRNDILNKLGLSLVPYKINNSKELLTFIKQSVDKSMPLFLLASYSKLYYTPNYLAGETKTHGVIINGYDEEKSIVILTETMPFNNSPLHLNSNPLYTMYLKENILEELWVDIMGFFKQTEDPNLDIIYRVEKTSKPLVSSYYELVNDFLNNYGFRVDKLILFIQSYNENRKDILNYIDYYRKEFYGSLQAFFRCLEYAFADIDKEDQDLADFISFKERYLKARSEILFALHLSAIRCMVFDENRINELSSQVDFMNKELNKYILCLQKKVTVKTSEKFINFALGKCAVADSEMKYGEKLIKASQALNGKCSNWMNDMWISDNKEKIHWFIVDLAESKKIHKIVIVHSGDQHKTIDFELYGSNDNLDWTLLSETVGNKEVETTHEIEPSMYRYIKLYITNPGAYDLNARICEFEVWGSDE